MEISTILWKFIHIVNTKSQTEMIKTKVFQKLKYLMDRNFRVFIHTSYLPLLPFEPNTYVMYENVEIAFEMLNVLYSRCAPYSEEARNLSNAYLIMKNDILNVQNLCNTFQSSIVL